MTCGSLAIDTPSARSRSTVDADIVDTKVDQGARRATLDQQASLAEPEERQARRIEDRDRRLTDQRGVERHGPIEIVGVLGHLVQDHLAAPGARSLIHTASSTSAATDPVAHNAGARRR